MGMWSAAKSNNPAPATRKRSSKASFIGGENEHPDPRSDAKFISGLEPRARPASPPARCGMEMEEAGAESHKVGEVAQVFDNDDAAKRRHAAGGFGKPGSALFLAAEFVDGEQREDEICGGVLGRPPVKRRC